MAFSQDLRLNFMPIDFDNEEFRGFELPYKDKEHLQELRTQYRDTHVFFRKGERIFCAPLSEDSEEFGKERIFNIKEDFIFFEHLVHQALIHFFIKKNFKFAGMGKPARIIRDHDNLLDSERSDEAIAQLMPMFPEYEIESRLIVPHKKSVKFGILLNFSVCQVITEPAFKLIEKGIDIKGRYVQIFREDLNPKVESLYNMKLAGRIGSIEGSQARLSDHDNCEYVDLKECYLESNRANIKHCLNSLAPEKAENISQLQLEQFFAVCGAKNQYQRLEKVRQWFENDQPIKCCVGLSFNLAKKLYKPLKGQEAGEYQKLTNPNFMLRPGGSISESRLPDKLIDKYGPFDTEDFTKKKVRIAVVHPARFKGDIEVFIRQLKDGIPIKGKKVTPFTQGFTRKYHLNSIDFSMFEIGSNDEDSAGYRKGCLEALGQEPGFDLAIIVTRRDFHSMHGADNPYFVSKSAFMSQGVPVQAIEIETLRNEGSKPYILNNFALACYAKIGGIPWVLSSAKGMTHELIFGIGSSKVQTERLSESERFVGITTVFSGDGSYQLYNLTNEVVFDDYEQALQNSLKICMDEIKARYAWQKGDSVRLIFHQSFKRFKDIEAQAVKKFVNGITDFEVEYTFVHISRSHPWKVFDLSSKGTDHWENYKKTIKGAHVPYRGFCIPLGPQSALLTLTGPPQLKTPLQGCPSPILVSVHPESTFNSRDYLVNQVYKLTFMSWRSFFPSQVPVTIEYSDMIARFLGNLREVPKWNSDALNTKLRESRWFL